MLRANIGNAVMDVAAPKNKTASKSVALSEKSPGTLLIQNAKKPPRIKGTTIPATETEAALCEINFKFGANQKHVEPHA